MIILKHLIWVMVFLNTPLLMSDVNTVPLKKDGEFDQYDNVRLKRINENFDQLVKNISKNQNLTKLYSETCLNYIDEIKDQKLKFQWMQKVGNLFIDNMVETQKALALYDKASKYYLVNAQLEELVKCYNKIGKAYYQIYNTRKSKYFFEKAFEYLDSDTMNMNTAELYQNYVSLLIRLDDQEEVFEYCIKLLKYYESINDKVNILAIKIKIGELYLENKQSDNAINFFTDILEEYDYHSISITEDRELKNNLFNLHFKLASAHRYKKQYDKALCHYYESLNIAKEQKIEHSYTRVYNAIGKTYFLNKDYKMALENLETALKLINSGAPSFFPSSVLYGNLSNCYASLGDDKKALFYANEALTYSENSSSLFLKSNSNNNAYKTFLILKEYDKALLYSQNRFKYKDSIRKVLASNKFRNLENKYDLIKEQRETENLIKDQKIEVLTIHKTKMESYFLMLLLLGSITITFIFLHKSRRFKNLAGALAKQNTVIKQQKSEIEFSLKKEKILSKRLNHTNDTLHKFFSIISHELRSPFNVILGFTNYLSSAIDTLDKNEIKKYVNGIRVSAQKNYFLTEDLLTWAALNHKGIKVNKEISSFKDIVDRIITENKEVIEEKNILINSSIVKSLKGNIDVNIVRTVLSNLIVNAIRHTGKGGEIFINAKMDKNIVCLEVNDTGVGMSSKETKELLEIDKVNSKKCSEGKFISGMGLILCKELLRCHNGYLKVKSKQGYGTSISAFLAVE